MLLAATAISACAPFQPYTDLSPRKYYTVQPGDNLHSIAFALETTPGELREANPWLDPAYFEPGTRLLVPWDSSEYRYPDSDQYYGDDQAGESIRHTDFIWPLNRIEVSSHFGRRRGRLHAGIDLRAPRGTPIQAAAAGRVKYVGYNRGYGHMVVIDHGGGIESAYAHNSQNLVTQGQRVEQGQVVARVGKSGNATGYHVHFEIRRHGEALNPIRHIQASL